MDFSDALRAVKEGKHVRRAIWEEHYTGGWLFLDAVRTADGATYSQLLVGFPDGRTGSFSGANADLLADDWELA